ncbi:MAG: hypothetical protein IPM54_00280 [Polyangiaceae bacterium]|nr:hypothetical protein [Polyangiaceae bacterium]
MWNASWEKGGLPRGIHKQMLVGMELEYAKCAWCERVLRWKSELDVEHYRPKAEVTCWDGSPPLVSDVGPKEVYVGPGYWWLAFSWDNYSLSCSPCNRGFKRNLFPVMEPRAACTEGVELTEKALLLDPGSAFRVRDHFRWTVDGHVEGVSEEGRATIITCGLNRRDLVVRRLKVALDVNETTDMLIRSSQSSRRDDMRSARKRLMRLGDRREEFTSMVRWLVEEKLRIDWEKLPRCRLDHHRAGNVRRKIIRHPYDCACNVVTFRAIVFRHDCQRR